jgi:hypothetical protein
MLIEKVENKYNVDDILSFKLVTGDEVLGKVAKIDTDSYELNKPCIVVTSSEGIGLIQAMFGLDPDLENLTLMDNHIVMMCRTHEKMRDHYITVTTNTR